MNPGSGPASPPASSVAAPRPPTPPHCILLSSCREPFVGLQIHSSVLGSGGFAHAVPPGSWGTPICPLKVESLPCETFLSFPNKASHFLLRALSVTGWMASYRKYPLASRLGGETLEGRDCALDSSRRFQGCGGLHACPPSSILPSPPLSAPRLSFGNPSFSCYSVQRGLDLTLSDWFSARS